MVPPARPALIAHRGMPRRHRENTLPGFVAATAAGADGWELDVHATADGVVVVHHDPVLPAAAGQLAGASIARLQWAELAEAVVGTAGERVPTLDAVLAAAAPGIAVYVEVKAAGLPDLVLATLRRHPGVQAAVHCFDHRVSLQLQALDPSVPVGILSESYPVDIAHALRSARARDFWPHRSMVDQDMVNAVHGAGGRVIVWTVNDVREAVALAALGVDGICTDVVDDMRFSFGD